MIFITYPAMLASLIPIIIIEALVIKFVLNSNWRETFLASSVCNSVSTIIGVPVAWGVFFLFEMAIGIPSGYFNINPGPILGSIFFAAWLGPNEKNLNWMVPLSSMVLLVGYFYASYWIERKVAMRFLKNTSNDEITVAFWRANIVSYWLLECIAAYFLAQALINRSI